MNFFRKVILANKLAELIDLPNALKNREVEIIVLPYFKEETKKMNKFKPEKYKGILNIKNIDKEIIQIRQEWNRV